MAGQFKRNTQFRGVGAWGGVQRTEPKTPVQAGSVNFGNSYDHDERFAGSVVSFPQESESTEDLKSQMESVRSYEDLRLLCEANRRSSAVKAVEREAREAREAEQEALLSKFLGQRPEWKEALERNAERSLTPEEIDRLSGMI